LGVGRIYRKLGTLPRKQNKFLEENKKSTNILERLIFGFAGLALIVALASLQLNISDESTSLGIFLFNLCFNFYRVDCLGCSIFQEFHQKNSGVV